MTRLATVDEPTRWWWTFLCGVAALNVAAWLTSALWLRRRGLVGAPAVRLHLLLSAGYVAGCAWRSALPVFDIQRLVLVDSALSSVLVGRSVATVAELCFAAQWALLLAEAARAVQARGARCLAGLILPMIVLAELFSWHAVLTTSNLGHVIEESLWAAAAALTAATMAWLAGRHGGRARLALRAAALAGAGYLAYMVAVDVPMYATRWLADEAAGRHYLSLAAGFADAAGRWTVSHRWADWHTEVVWMSLYFSVAVWISIALAHLRWAPSPAPAIAAPR